MSVRFAGDEQWAETGDRYLLKLLRDHLFHQVHPSGSPWLNLAHIVQTLNKVRMCVCLTVSVSKCQCVCVLIYLLLLHLSLLSLSLCPPACQSVSLPPCVTQRDLIAAGRCGDT